MSEPMINSLFGFGGSIIGVIGLVVGYLISARSSRLSREAQVEANNKSNEQVLIDQLQEEVRSRDSLINARATELDARMNRLDEQLTEITEQRDKLRGYAHLLRGQIFDGAPPPPIAWPEGVYL